MYPLWGLSIHPLLTIMYCTSHRSPTMFVLILHNFLIIITFNSLHFTSVLIVNNFHNLYLVFSYFEIVINTLHYTVCVEWGSVSVLHWFPTLYVVSFLSSTCVLRERILLKVDLTKCPRVIKIRKHCTRTSSYLFIGLIILISRSLLMFTSTCTMNTYIRTVHTHFL